ncbi:MAG: NAD(P)H-dependent oxidoreductase [Myxococcota bacterium]|nr:NAD(P)H-dependent oxidoreductase [Myxococcota bacterium]MEC8424881.1 NAD(P)H-dependent oxidoreductase [Myxococcota bacterium]
MKLVVLPGTNREGSKSLRVGHALATRYGAMEGVDAELLDLRGLPAGLLDSGSYASKPRGFAAFADAVLGADGLHVVTPEYNGGMPGVLKLFIDHLPFPEAFERRPVCFTGVAAGRFGALRPVEQLQAVFGYRNALQYPDRVFLAGVHNALDDAGWPTDPLVGGLLADQVAGFVTFIRAVSTVR